MPPQFYARHPGPYPFPDARMRPPMSQGEIKEGFRSPIVKDQDLKDMDSLESAGGSWWASATGEVDYNEKLVFSDEEDDRGDAGDDKPGKKDHRGGRGERRSERDSDRGSEKYAKHEDDDESNEDRAERSPYPPNWQQPRFPGGPPKQQGRPAPWEYSMMGYPPQGPYMPPFRGPAPSQKPAGRGGEEGGRPHRSSRSDDADLAAEYEDWTRDKQQPTNRGTKARPDDSDSRPMMKLPVRGSGSRESLQALSPSPRVRTATESSSEKYNPENSPSIPEDSGRGGYREDDDYSTSEIKSGLKDLSLKDNDDSKRSDKRPDDSSRYSKQPQSGGRRQQEPPSSRYYDDEGDYEGGRNERRGDPRSQRGADNRYSADDRGSAQDRRAKGQGQQPPSRSERGNDRTYGRGQSWEEPGYDEYADQSRRPQRGDKASEGRRGGDDRRRKVPAERQQQQAGRREDVVAESEKQKPYRRQPGPGRGGAERSAESHTSYRAYDEREFEDIGDTRAKTSREHKKDRAPALTDLDAEAGSADDSDVQPFRGTSRARESKAPPPMILRDESREHDEPEHSMVSLKRTQTSTAARSASAVDASDKVQPKEATQQSAVAELPDSRNATTVASESNEKAYDKSRQSVARSKNAASAPKEEKRPMATLSKASVEKSQSSSISEDKTNAKPAPTRAENKPVPNVWAVKSAAVKVEESVASLSLDDKPVSAVSSESKPKETSVAERAPAAPVIKPLMELELRDSSYDGSARAHIQREGSHDGLSPPKRPKEDQQQRAPPGGNRGRRARGNRGPYREDSYEGGLEFVRSRNAYPSQQSQGGRGGQYDANYYYEDDEYAGAGGWPASGRDGGKSAREPREGGRGGKRQQQSGSSAAGGQGQGQSGAHRAKDKPVRGSGQGGKSAGGKERMPAQEGGPVESTTSADVPAVKSENANAGKPTVWAVPAAAVASAPAEASVKVALTDAPPPKTNPWKIPPPPAPVTEKAKPDNTEERPVEREASSSKVDEQAEKPRQQRPRGEARGGAQGQGRSSRRGNRGGERDTRDVLNADYESGGYRGGGGMYSDRMLSEEGDLEGDGSRRGPPRGRGKIGSDFLV